ncbi:sugar-binding protein [Streptosporangium sp. V21-05]|uniref:sugar-binding protein n=1 Tax=Streptosporangium sp. V21-05 TaxID=3446115 RepID=UPI003F529BE0
MRTPRPVVLVLLSLAFSLVAGTPAAVPAAAVTTTAAATIATYDFESGTQGWGPRGGGVSVATTPAPVHGGAGALLTTGRTATWHGAALTPPFEKGVADDATWLSSFPITRLNPPLPFDDELQAKPAYWGVADPGRLPPVSRSLNAPAGTVTVDGKRDGQWDLLPDAPVARTGDLSAAWQARTTPTGLYVLAEVTDPTDDRTDTVTFTVGGTQYRIQRGGTHAHGFKAHAKRTATGYRVEALLPSGTATGVRVAVADAGRKETTWTGELVPVPAIRTTSAPKGAPVVDGVADAAWSGVPEVTTGTRIQGTSGATATVRAMWKAGTLYVLARVTDPVLSEESPNAWEQDSVEIFVDPENNKTRGYDDDDGQYRISFTGGKTVGGTFDAFAVKDNLTGAATRVAGGYVVEAAIRLPTVTLARGALLGFDVQVNDATGTARTAAATWNDPTGRSYVDTSRWGVLRLAT